MNKWFKKFIYLYILIFILNNFKNLIDVSFFLIYILLIISYISFNFLKDLKNNTLLLKKNELLKIYFFNIINNLKILYYYKDKLLKFINQNFLLTLLSMKIIKLNYLIKFNNFLNFLYIRYFNFLKDYKFFKNYIINLINLLILNYILLIQRI